MRRETLKFNMKDGQAVIGRLRNGSSGNLQNTVNRSKNQESQPWLISDLYPVALRGGLLGELACFVTTHKLDPRSYSSGIGSMEWDTRPTSIRWWWGKARGRVCGGNSFGPFGICWLLVRSPVIA